LGKSKIEIGGIMKKKKENSLFWRVIISLVGFMLILLALMNLFLFLFGEKVEIDFTTRRIGGANNDYDPQKRYEWSIDYEYVDMLGNVQNGSTTRRGSDMNVKVGEFAYYFKFAPKISSLESEVVPNFGQLIYLILGFILIKVMNPKKKNVSDKRRWNNNNVDDLNDYDDSVEETYDIDESDED
jgi:hypothetical protein